MAVPLACVWSLFKRVDIPALLIFGLRTAVEAIQSGTGVWERGPWGLIQSRDVGLVNPRSGASWWGIHMGSSALCANAAPKC